MLVMGDSPEKKTIQVDSVSNSIRFFPLLFCMKRFHCTRIKSEVQRNYKTLINHESRCSNSRQEEVREQRDGTKGEGV